MSQMYSKNLGINLNSCDVQSQAGRQSGRQTVAFKKARTKKQFSPFGALMSIVRTLQMFLLPNSLLMALERASRKPVVYENEAKLDYATICKSRLANLQHSDPS